MRIVLLTLLALSCATHEDKSSNDDRIPLLQAEFEKRQDEYAEITLDKSGWPSVKDCDATLWAGEVCSAGMDVDIFLAEYPQSGQLQRRPAPSCFENGQTNGSASSVSNDMILGYLSCLWRLQDLSALQRLAEYGESNNWVMGEPNTSDRVYLKPNQQGLLGRALTKLGDKKSYANIPAIYFPVEKDYEKHLQVLGILLNGEIDESIDASMLKRLKELAKDNSDALIQAAYGRYTGDQSIAISLLLSDTPIPTYVRGSDNYKLVYWLKAASVVLN